MTSLQIRYAATKITLLTTKQQKILRLKCEGFSAQSIASQLNLRVQNVNRNADKLYQKLGIHCIAEAVRVALVASVIDDSI